MPTVELSIAHLLVLLCDMMCGGFGKKNRLFQALLLAGYYSRKLSFMVLEPFSMLAPLGTVLGDQLPEIP